MKQKSIILKSLLMITPVALQATDTVRKESPNILFILSDDQGWSQVSKPMHTGIPESCSHYLNTKNIDRLGDSGIRFTSGYAPAPLCTPSRRSILCGVTAARGGTEFKSSFVPADHLTIPKALKQANPEYLCAHFGKWGGPTMISLPEECGYDASDGQTGNPTGGMPSTLGVTGSHKNGPTYFIDNQDPKRTVSVTNSAVNFMRGAVEKGRPFFVQVSYYAVHLSVVCGEETLAKYQLRGQPDRGYPPAWAAMLDEMDQGVGRLLDLLNELNIADNTYVFFMSDNGGSESIPGKIVDAPHLNHPLSGSKQSLLEGGIRVPFLVSGPGITPGSYSNIPVTGYDLLPTFYDLAGGKQQLTGEIDGGSIRPLFNDPVNGVVKRPLDALIFHRPGYLSSAIRQGPDKLFVTWNQKGRIKSLNLYNLDEDVVENGCTDIARTNSRRAKQLKNILLDYLLSVNAKNPKTIIDELPVNQRRAMPIPVIEE